MNNKEFIQRYEELLNSGYCECNELNCLDNNSPKRILNIMKEQQQEIERLNNIINELENYIRARVDDNNSCSVCSVMTDDLLNILKGSDKE